MKQSSQIITNPVAISRVLYVVSGLTLTKEVNNYLHILQKEVSKHGVKPTCVYLKSLYTQAVRYSFNLTVEPIPFRKSGKDGLAKDLRPFKPLLNSKDPIRKRCALTILRHYTLLYTEPELDVTSIVTPVPKEKVQAIAKSFNAFACVWVPPMDPRGKIEIIPRARSGPNGPSLLSSHLDAVALYQRPELLKSLDILAGIIDPSPFESNEPISLGGIPAWDPSKPPAWKQNKSFTLRDLPGWEGVFDTDFDWRHPKANPESVAENKQVPAFPEFTQGKVTKWVDELTKWTESNFPKRKCDVSKLALLSEGGGKTRTIAIADELTQSVLRPIHKKVMGYLRKLDQDCTFDQEKAVTFLKEATKKGPVYSFDLTTATDRFPLELQQGAVTALFGEEFARLWADVMSNHRDFIIKQRVKYKGRRLDKSPLTNVYYKQGQGMGIYSSWPVFALTHHILIQWCAYKEGITPISRTGDGKLPFTEYRIIGDDVAIVNTKVASRYKITLEALEVPISEAKSIISEHRPYCGEIAKRLIHNGVDISPIPADLIRQAGYQVAMIPCLIDEIGKRYGLDLQTLSRLPILARQFTKRKGAKDKAVILLTAPRAFALYKCKPLYGNTLIDNEDQATQLLSMVLDSPWGGIMPELINSFGQVQDQVRKNFLLEQYESIYKEWKSDRTNSRLLSSILIDRWARRDKTGIAIPDSHPLRKANDWITAKLNAGISALVRSYTNRSIEDFTLSLKDLNLRFCIDPSMRSYLDRKYERSKISSHLTIEIYKVLMGFKPLPKFKHPDNGIRDSHMEFKPLNSYSNLGSLGSPEWGSTDIEDLLSDLGTFE